MSKATVKDLDALHSQLAKALADEITSMTKVEKDADGQPIPKDKKGLASLMNVARQFLKDNGVEALVAPGSALGNLAASLPFPGGEDMPPEDYPLN